MKELNLGYVAGIIDGEGSIMLIKKDSASKYRTPMVTVSSTTRELLEYLKFHFGGCILTKNEKRENYKESFTWKIEYDKALECCELIQPYILVPEKSYRIDLLLNQYKAVTKRNGKYSNEEALAKIQFENLFLHPQNIIDESLDEL